MLFEIIIYMTLFSAVFSGLFSATFQGMEAISHLEQRKDILDSQDFLQTKLSVWLGNSTDWQILPYNILQFKRYYADESLVSHVYNLSLENNQLIIKCLDCSVLFSEQISGNTSAIESFFTEIISNASSSTEVLKISFKINGKDQVYNYYNEK